MAYEINDMSWSLFKNDRKETENHPDYTGQGKVNGREVWLSAWLKESKDGRKYFSGSFKFKEAKQERQEPQGGSFSQELSDEIPFGPSF